MQFRKVNILRDETTSILHLVAEWELPLLEAKHGDERLTIGELVEAKNREWPMDAKSEFNRLAQLYGMTGSGDNAQSFVERAYGPGSVGVKALERAMADARGDKKARKRTEDVIGATA
ncbi:MAG: hypothetical protein V4532_15365 [Pseudomonadota bacterium]